MEIMQFDSFEDALAMMERNTEWANAHLHEAQRRVTWGGYWVRFYDVPNKVLIFGRVFTEAEMEAGERVVHPGEDPDEAAADADATIARVRSAHERGYLFGMCYSVLEPDGEPGDTHRANLWPITQGLFDAARVAGWRLDDLDHAAKFALSAVYADWGNHQRTLAALRG